MDSPWILPWVRGSHVKSNLRSSTSTLGGTLEMGVQNCKLEPPEWCVPELGIPDLEGRSFRHSAEEKIKK